jgi:4-oxalocrotonate tautomerase family enzyme
MPIVTVETWPLKNEAKPAIIKKITTVFTEMGIPAQSVTVIIHETPLENWGTEGEQHSITYKDLKATSPHLNVDP